MSENPPQLSEGAHFLFGVLRQLKTQLDSFNTKSSTEEITRQSNLESIGNTVDAFYEQLLPGKKHFQLRNKSSPLFWQKRRHLCNTQML